MKEDEDCEPQVKNTGITVNIVCVFSAGLD